MVKKQRILTPQLGTILSCLMEAQRRGEEIVSVFPHLSSHGIPCGYIVVVNEAEDAISRHREYP